LRRAAAFTNARKRWYTKPTRADTRARRSGGGFLEDAIARHPAAPTLARTVVLVGLMGAGKTSVGRRLAETLGVPFRDSDDEIVAAAGMDIPTIFSALGEPAFREGERKVIARLLTQPPHVLATGGGAFMDPATRRVVAQRAVAVWIDADLDTLVERTGRKDTRPLLRDGDPREILGRLLRERAPAYAEAAIRVRSTQMGTHDVVVADIVDALRLRGLTTAAAAE
jgi:shikimate kinase